MQLPTIPPKLLERAVKRWGQSKQLIKIQEEALELSLSITQYQCPTKDRGAMLDAIYGELADNYIMTHYYPLIFDKERIGEIVKKKLQSLEEILDRLDEEEQESADELAYERSVSED